MAFKTALYRCFFWITLAVICNAIFWGYLHHTQGLLIANTKALEFLTGYLIEFLLSLDNMFVFVVIFQYFRIPDQYQSRVLSWGIIGAVVMRLILIVAGLALIEKFHWLIYALGLLLIWVGFKILINKEEVNFSDSKLLQFLKRHARVSSEAASPQFFIRQNKLLYMTPLFLALLCVEGSDLLFSLDSLPAIFSVTQDPFIVYTSNILAILGLRSLYFVVARCSAQFQFLKYGIAIILIFIGLKMGGSLWIHLPIWITLLFVSVVLVLSVMGSYVKGYFKKHR